MKHQMIAASLAVAFGTCVLATACGTDGVGGTDDSIEAGPGFGTDGGADGFAGCGTRSKAEKLPVDMVIGLDTSFSMDFDSKWSNVRSAMKSFVGNPAYAELGIAVQFFPIRKQCSVADYAQPAVPLALQPVVKAPIIAALDLQQMAGGTPMVPLLEGLNAYLKANAKPTRKPVIVLATDGFPDDSCPGGAGQRANTIENAVAVATEALNGSPPVFTFVIGVGGELSALNAISQAGGTGDAILVDTSTNAEAAFLKALDTIRRAAIPCDYPISAELGVDVEKTNVTYTPAGGASQSYVFVGNEAGCAKAPNEGWYFDNEAKPTKVILCKGACDVVKADDTGSVEVVVGCPRIIR